MSLSSDVIERLPRVEGLLNYLAPMAEKPMNLTYDPPPGVPRSTGIPEPHVMRIHDARPVAGRLTLDGEGLALVEHRSAVKDFYDEDELRRVYYPEAIRLVADPSLGACARPRARGGRKSKTVSTSSVVDAVLADFQTISNRPSSLGLMP
jgi:hypothetical protein